MNEVENAMMVSEQKIRSTIMIKASTINPKKFRLSRNTPLTLTVPLNTPPMKKLLTQEERDSLTVDGRGNVTISVSHNMPIDTSTDYGQAILKILRTYPTEIAASLDKCDSNIRYYIEDRQAEASGRVSKRKRALVAENLITKMNLKEKREMGYALGEKLSYYSEAELEDFLFSRAAEDPDKFVSRFNDPNKKQRIMLHRLLENRIFIQESNNAIMYGDTLIGIDEDVALGWFNDVRNAQTIHQLSEKIKGNAV